MGISYPILTILVVTALVHFIQGYSVLGLTSKCGLPMKKGPCRAAIRRYYHNRVTGKCQQFYYGGCRGNANNFDSHRACRRECEGSVNVCTLESVVGPCRASKIRFYYDYRSKKCEQFRYGGCRGNGNNFISERACKAKCGNPTGTIFVQPMFCRLSVKVGTCRSRKTRYFYDTTTKTCERFTYTGCRGNRNRFRSYADCETTCSPPR